MAMKLAAALMLALLVPSFADGTSARPLRASEGAQEKPKAPPKGPPWTTDWRAARWESLRTGKPIFLYFTKTY